jgi:hypothetical protein
MVFLIGLLLVILVGAYISYPFFASKIGNRQTYTKEELRIVEEEIEREILALRKYPNNSETSEVL